MRLSIKAVLLFAIVIAGFVALSPHKVFAAQYCGPGYFTGVNSCTTSPNPTYGTNDIFPDRYNCNKNCGSPSINAIPYSVYSNVPNSLTANLPQSTIKKNLIAFVEAKLKSTDVQRQIGAAFYINTMGAAVCNGGAKDTTPNAAYIACWESLINDSRLTITTATPKYTRTTFYDPGTKDVLYANYTTGPRPSLVLKYGASEAYSIELACGNPAGQLQQLKTPAPAASMKVEATASDTSVVIGSTVTFTGKITTSKVTNEGSATYGWTTSGIVTPSSNSDQLAFLVFAGNSNYYGSSTPLAQSTTLIPVPPIPAFSYTFNNAGTYCWVLTATSYPAYVTFTNASNSNSAMACVNVTSGPQPGTCPTNQNMQANEPYVQPGDTVSYTLSFPASSVAQTINYTITNPSTSAVITSGTLPIAANVDLAQTNSFTAPAPGIYSGSWTASGALGTCTGSLSVVVMPTFRLYGSSVHAGGGFTATTGCDNATNNAGFIGGWFNDNSVSAGYGSKTALSAIALAKIVGFASGQTVNVSLASSGAPPPSAHVALNSPTNVVRSPVLATSTYIAGKNVIVAAPYIQNKNSSKIQVADATCPIPPYSGAGYTCSVLTGIKSGILCYADPQQFWTGGKCYSYSIVSSGPPPPAPSAATYMTLSFANDTSAFATSGVNGNVNNFSPNLGGMFNDPSGGGTYCISDASPPNGSTAQVSNVVNIGGLTTDANTSSATGVVELSGTTIPSGHNMSFFADNSNDIYISGNIVYGYNSVGTWGVATDIPSLVVHTTGNIYIDPSVTTLDGIYIAQGNIYTCAIASGPVTADLYDNCKNRLTVHGSFVANQVNLMRTYGTLRDGSTGVCTQTSGQPIAVRAGVNSCAAEVFDFSPEMYLANPAINVGNGTLHYDSIVSLPPIL